MHPSTAEGSQLPAGHPGRPGRPVHRRDRPRLSHRCPARVRTCRPCSDTSYNAVEGARAQYGVAPDTSYSTVESMRAKSGVTENTDFDVLAAARAKAAAHAGPSPA